MTDLEFSAPSEIPDEAAFRERLQQLGLTEGSYEDVAKRAKEYREDGVGDDLMHALADFSGYDADLEALEREYLREFRRLQLVEPHQVSVELPEEYASIVERRLKLGGFDDDQWDVVAGEYVDIELTSIERAAEDHLDG